MAAKRTLSAKQVLEDIKSGMSDDELMEKHALSSKGLQNVLDKLVSAGLMKQSELQARSELFEDLLYGADIRVHYDYGSVIAGVRELHQKADERFPKSYLYLLDRVESREHIPRTGECFDVGEYFRVFRHISPPPGYELDYEYWCSGGDGAPDLFLRPITAPNVVLNSQELLADLPKWRRNIDLDAERPSNHNELANQRAREREEEKRQNPLASRLQADGTPESFFELVLFNAVAGQFYLAWHAAYNDIRVLTERIEVQRILGEIATIPDDQKNWALGIDVYPHVHFLSDELAEVSVIMFSDYEGLFRVTEQISRTYPHRFLHTEKEILVEYEGGLQF
jgi:hypothetical protein